MKSKLIYTNTKGLANSFLLISFCLYVISSCLKHKFPILQYVVAFSEAAMIGGIADWFAVTALFRHPFGIPIPHTAIIPNSKNKIGQNISNFIRENFLSTQYVQENINKIQITTKIGELLQSNKSYISNKAISFIFHLSKTFKYEELQDYITLVTKKKANEIDIQSIVLKLSKQLKDKGQHRELIDYLLTRANIWLSDKDNEHAINEQIKILLKKNDNGKSSFGGVLKGWIIGEPKLHQYLSDFLKKIKSDPDKEFYHHVDNYFSMFIEHIEKDPKMTQQILEIKDDIIESLDIDHSIASLMIDINSMIENDLISDNSRIKEKINQILDDIIHQCTSNEKFKIWIQEHASQYLPKMIISNAEKIDNYFIDYVEKLDAKEISSLIEEKVGEDLQFVRINGTLVGGLIGLAIFSGTEFVTFLGTLFTTT